MRADARLVQQLGLLAASMVLELVLFRMWLLTGSLERTNALTALLTERGPGTLRFVVVQLAVAFGMVALIFGESTGKSLKPLFIRFAQSGIAWPALFAHGVMVVLFGELSAILLGTPISYAPGLVIAVLWVVSGVLTVGLLAIAFMPPAFWTLLIRSMRQALVFAFVVSVGAYAFGRLALTAWQPLSRATMTVVHAMLHPLVPALSADPSTLTIGTPDFRVEISAQCSGYEGLGLMLVFITAWLWFHRAEWRFPRAFILLPIGLAGIWMLNCARVALLLLIGIGGAPEIAVGGFHSQAGWLAFNAVALGTCVVARRVPWLLSHEASISASHSQVPNPTVAYLMPFLAVLGGSMVAQLVSSGFDWFYAIRVVLSGAVLCYFVPRYRALDWRIGWRAIAIGAGVFVIWVGMEKLINTRSPGDIPAALREAPAAWAMAWIAFRVLGSVATASIAEELAFRGFLLRRLDSEDFESVRWNSVSWTAIVVSSAAFGALHGDRWLAGTIAGALYACAYLRRGSIGDAVAAHATTNLLIAAEVLVAGRWELW
jgi:exosortase E/protease (VPEID-CTERM system)